MSHDRITKVVDFGLARAAAKQYELAQEEIYSAPVVHRDGAVGRAGSKCGVTISTH